MRKLVTLATNLFLVSPLLAIQQDGMERKVAQTRAYFGETVGQTASPVPSVRPGIPDNRKSGSSAPAIGNIADNYLSVDGPLPSYPREAPRERTIRECKQEGDSWCVMERGNIWDAVDYTKGALAFAALLGGVVGGLAGYASVATATSVLEGALLGGLIGVGLVVVALLTAKFVAFRDWTVF